MRKLIAVTAPSGAGKTTIVRHLLSKYDNLDFSVSATTREIRKKEVNGKDYYFIGVEKFKHKIKEGAFIEWQEVYENQFYGTLKSEVDRLWMMDKDIIFDIDVKGAVNIKKMYPESLCIFIKPPSFEVLENRLKNRKTETPKSLAKRIGRVKNEMTYENKFDIVLVNDVLEVALKEAEKIIENFVNS